MSEYTGKDVSYYLVEIAAPKRLDPYTAECEDIIEALNMTFAEGCAFKAIWRKCAARTLGIAKAGYKGGLYDAEKTQYYGARMVAVEGRLSKVPSAAERGSLFGGPVIHTMTNPPGEGYKLVDRCPECNVVSREEKLHLTTCSRLASCPEGGKISIHFGEQPKCPECGYPTDAAGTHYATCSRLTAPEEYKTEAQVAFEEAAELSEALARQVSAGNIDTDYDDGTTGSETLHACEFCGAVEFSWHRPDCAWLRRGKSRLGNTPADLHAKQAEEEPAAAIDDDSARMQSIGQNGEMAEEVYAAVDAADPFAGAPDWAKYKAQDMNGQWYWYECAVYSSGSQWVEADKNGRLDEAEGGEPNPNWRDTLITRT